MQGMQDQKQNVDDHLYKKPRIIRVALSFRQSQCIILRAMFEKLLFPSVIKCNVFQMLLNANSSGVETFADVCHHTGYLTNLSFYILYI